MTGIAEEIRERIGNPYYIALLVILGVATFLRFRYAFFQGLWVDEGNYARIGLELSDHLLNYSAVTHGQITSYPPGFLYLLGLSTAILGKTDFAIRIVSPLLGVLGVGITYFLGREVRNRDVGMAAAALLAVNPTYWFLNERVLIDGPLAVIYTAAVFCLFYGLEDRRHSKYALWALGPVTALAILTKQPAYSLGIVIPFYFAYRKRNELREILVDRVEFTKSEFYLSTLRNRNYYISAALGILTLLPWMLRNMAVCQFPLCGLSRAARFASVGSPPAWASTGGPFMFILGLPSILTLPLTILLGFRIVQYVLETAGKDPDMLVKYGAGIAALNILAFLLTPKLVPMALLTSITMLARTDAEKLLWLWIGIGIGFMSIPSIKVNRYITFTIPAMLTVSSIALYSIADWIEGQIDVEQLNASHVMALLVVPLFLFSYTVGVENVSRHSFQQLEPAGKWLDENIPEDAAMAASSYNQMQYYAYPRRAYMPPENKSRMPEFIEEKNISYVVLDVYERAQPKWTQLEVGPYRLPVSTVQKLRSRQLSPQQVLMRFGQTPEYLEHVKSFGSTKAPLTGQQQPEVIVYRVNFTGR